MLKRSVRTAGLLLLLACQNSRQAQPGVQPVSADSKGLKDYYRNYFPVGVAVSPQVLRSADTTLILREFNSLTPENALKMGPVHPEENRYYWRDADAILDFARQHGMRVRGHTLCWHNQTPAWIFKDGDRTVDKAVLLQRLKAHIQTVVSRYKGRIYAWDVVNEAISDRPGEYLRPSPWLQICGPEYIARAFEYAHEADPDAILFYNDYNEINPVKRAKIYRLVKELKEAGVPIHAVGLQSHWAVNEPTRNQLDSTIRQLAALDLPLQITELDLSVYSKEHDARNRRFEDADTSFTAARARQQADQYRMSFEVFRRYRKNLTGVTFWNVTDRYSWLDDFPVKNRKDHPLLFDVNGNRKQAAYEAVTQW